MNDRRSIPLSVVLMAKQPVVGKVKTRLIGELTAEQAADVHVAMMHCVVNRLDTWNSATSQGQGVMAMDSPPSQPLIGTWRVIDQGAGDLGDRLLYVWEQLGSGPAVFFGVDSPDVPTEYLDHIAHGLRTADAACGPVEDGGYWTIAANRPTPALLRDIDWGSDLVYDQTRQRAAEGNIRLHELPAWHDVDTFEDLVALRRRIDDTTDPHLAQLRDQLDAISERLT